MCLCIGRLGSLNDDGCPRRNVREAWKGREKAKHPCLRGWVAELAANPRFASFSLLFPATKRNRYDVSVAYRASE